tara:strand:+ start:14622 stop:15473 length:852 start_codon:yes stop_codon:yes gene_type:complete
MKIIIDERETALYEKCYSLLLSQEKAFCVEIIKEVLPIGDVIIKTDDNKDVLVIERKTFNDLFASIKDGRYEEQSHRLLHTSGVPPHSIIYLLEGIVSQLEKPNKKLLYSTITSLQFFKGFSIQRTSSTMDTAEWLFYMAAKIERNFIKGVVPYYLTEPFHRIFNEKPEDEEDKDDKGEGTVFKVNPDAQNYCNFVKKTKKDNITRDNIGEIILCQIPGISSITAITIMKHFNNFPDFLERLRANPTQLNDMCIENNGKKRKISKTIIENIQKYLLDSTDVTT